MHTAASAAVPAIEVDEELWKWHKQYEEKTISEALGERVEDKVEDVFASFQTEEEDKEDDGEVLYTTAAPSAPPLEATDIFSAALTAAAPAEEITCEDCNWIAEAFFRQVHYSQEKEEEDTAKEKSDKVAQLLSPPASDESSMCDDTVPFDWTSFGA